MAAVIGILQMRFAGACTAAMTEMRMIPEMMAKHAHGIGQVEPK